ncbi:methionine--tRNA ligase [bacterium]|nr:methionine--tRNA ligase [bacterium]
MSKKFFITTPIFYVNDEPHLGHAYNTIITDILARYHRQMGDDVFFLTGTDEHGQKVQEAAERHNRTPKVHCDLMVTRFQDVWQKLNISHDDFIRTTEERHTRVVQEILTRLWDAGEIYADEYEGWYSVSEERFLTEKEYAEGEFRDVRRLKEKNYFFKMSQYQDWLIDYIKSHDDFIQPKSRRNEVLGFLDQPLGDLCISRPKERLSWGIELPFDDQFVTYVWFDALFNYYSAPLSKGKDIWPASLHLIGKDILTTHCVYWPTMLKASGLEIPETIFGHGWWLVEDTKMSKSLGNVVKPLQLIDKYGVDAFRFFVVREMSLGQDASFSETALVNRYNSELANDLGNLYSRLLKLLHTFSAGKIPEKVAGDQYPGRPLLGMECTTVIENLELNKALEHFMAFVRGINKFVEDAAPWKKGKTDPEGTKADLRIALEDLATAAYCLWPVMPDKMGEILTSLGIDDPLNIQQETVAQSIITGKELPKKASLFPRVMLETPKETVKAETKQEELITFDDFKKVKLRVAKIISAEPAPKSDKLLILQVDLGDEKRQIVAGVAEYYQPEALVGKSIVVVTNLKPAKIRGNESEGMMLAADDGQKLTFITIDDDLPPGSEVR